MNLWRTDAVARPVTVEGHATTGIAVSQADAARAIALVYAGFGDGPQTAKLIAAAPELVDAAIALLDWYGGLRHPEKLPNRRSLSWKIRALNDAVKKATE